MNRLAQPSAADIKTLMGWFNSELELREWAGPAFAHPFDVQSFTSDLKLDSLDSFSMLSQNGELLAFGQCYERVGRWHLGRLAVSPNHRGQGLVQKLIYLLAEFGHRQHGLSSNSLFVLEANASAIRAYEKCGFTMTEYPEAMPMQNTFYMIREAEC
jgi:ribosomal protein S18 acetylase RimI-like enzyme